MSDSVSELVLASAFINLLVWATLTAVAVGYMRLPIFHPFAIYTIYHFLGFVVRPFNIYANEGSFIWDRIGFEPSSWDILLTTVVANAAYLFVFAGFVYGAGGKLRPLQAPMPYQLQVARSTPFYLGATVLLALGLYANFRSVSGAGLDTVLAYGTEIDSAGGGRLVGISGYVTALAEFIPPICILLVMIPKARNVGLVVIAGYIVLRVFAGAQRLSFVVVIAGVFFYYLVSTRRRYPSVAAISLIVIFAFVFDIVGSDRYALRKIFSGDSTVMQVVDAYSAKRGGNSLTSDVVEYDVSTASLSVIDSNSEYSLGTQYLRIIIWPIPRQLWTDKPVYTSIVDLNKYGDFRYLTIGVYADTYMVLSFVSLVPMMFLLGVFFSRIYNKFIVANSANWIMFYWVVLIFTKTILRDGGVTVFYFWILSMIPVVVLVALGGVKVCHKRLS